MRMAPTTSASVTLNALRPPTHDEKQACYEIGCYQNGTRGSLARPFPARNTFPNATGRAISLNNGGLLADASISCAGCVPRQTSRIPSLIAHADLAVFMSVESEGCIIGLE